MGAPTVHLVLDEPRRQYLSREPVRGRVEVRADKEWFGTLELVWSACSKGTYDRERKAELHREQLYAGVVNTGDSLTRTFEIAAPLSPPSHAGEHVQLGWKLGVVAEDGAGNAVRDEVDVVVSLPPGHDLELKPMGLAGGDPAKVTDFSARKLIVVSLVALVCGGVGVYGIFTSSSFLSWFFGIWGLLFVGWSFVELGHWLGLRDVGNVQMAIDRATTSGYREAAGRERPYLCTVWTLPKARVETATVTLEVLEHSESVKTEHSQRRVSQKVLWSGSGDLALREPGTWRGRLPVPEAGTVPTTGGAMCARILWRATARLLLVDGDAHTKKLQLRAKPEIARKHSW